MLVFESLKNLIEGVPEGVGKPLAYVPYSLRLGLAYPRTTWAINGVAKSDNTQTEGDVIALLGRLLSDTLKSIPFYREIYQLRGYTFQSVQTLHDWQKIPVVAKSDLQAVSLENRSSSRRGGMKVNTGGTSGQPLEFLLDNQAFAREWAHMHYIWKARGYHPHHIKLTFRGKHFDSSRAIRYNAVHNEYVVNANSPMTDVVNAVLALPRRTVIRWVHGYPSLVAEFAHAVSRLAADDLEHIRGRLFGALLGSEYPAPIYRDVIECVLTTNVVSWYGHSEMAVLAREIARGVYQSLPTYGFAEAVPTEDGSAHRLVCTSLHNRVHPFIRYDTGDLIEPIAQADGSLTFRIAEGRVGDFIEDGNGQRHSLTAIIFGRHHPIFNQLQHLQVRQDAPGSVTLVVTPLDLSLDTEVVRQGFDLNDLPIEWRVEKVEAPVRTSLDKIRLKIS